MPFDSDHKRHAMRGALKGLMSSMGGMNMDRARSKKRPPPAKAPAPKPKRERGGTHAHMGDPSMDD